MDEARQSIMSDLNENFLITDEGAALSYQKLIGNAAMVSLIDPWLQLVNAIEWFWIPGYLKASDYRKIMDVSDSWGLP